MVRKTNEFFYMTVRDNKKYLKIKSPNNMYSVNKYISFQNLENLIHELSNNLVKLLFKSEKETALFFDNARYNIYSLPEVYVQRWGYGGEIGSATVLEKDGKKILVSLRLHCWDTLSDDSEDYPIGNNDLTSLIEDDSLGRKVFQNIIELKE